MANETEAMRRVIVGPTRSFPNIADLVDKAAKAARTDPAEYARRSIVRALREDGLLRAEAAHV